MFLKNKIQLLFVCTVISFGLVECASTYRTTSTENPSIITYNTHIKPILKNYCLPCHSGETPYGRIDLSTYKVVREKAEKGVLLKRINDATDPMPPMGLLPKEDRDLIMKWAENNFLEDGQSTDVREETYEFVPPEIQAINIDKEGFEFMEAMQGHWVGKMKLMGKPINWFAFDYRPISSSHIHGIFEGGSMGNLFTSFFVADYKGTKTIMARNGGILSGFYRTSYFVLDKVDIKNNETYYRFVDAYGGEQIMYMELTFKGNEITFTSYTSRLGMYPKPRKHMEFKAKRQSKDLAEKAAEMFDFPKNIIEKDFSEGLPNPVWEEEYATITSASYLWTDLSKDLIELGKLSKDPIRIDEMPYLSTVNLQFNKDDLSKDKKIIFYLSKQPLTDDNGKLLLEYGYVNKDLMNDVFLFPEISENTKAFVLTYLHPGDYYLTAFVDNNGDYTPSKGDFSSKSQLINVKPESEQNIVVEKISIEN